MVVPDSVSSHCFDDITNLVREGSRDQYESFPQYANIGITHEAWDEAVSTAVSSLSPDKRPVFYQKLDKKSLNSFVSTLTFRKHIAVQMVEDLSDDMSEFSFKFVVSVFPRAVRRAGDKPSTTMESDLISFRTALSPRGFQDESRGLWGLKRLPTSSTLESVAEEDEGQTEAAEGSENDQRPRLFRVGSLSISLPGRTRIRRRDTDSGVGQQASLGWLKRRATQ